MDILQMSLSASVLIVVVVAIRALALHKLPKKTFLVLWGVVLCRLLVPFSIPSRFSFYTGIEMVKRLLAKRTAVSSPAGMTDIPHMANISGTGEPIGAGASTMSISPIEIVWLAGMCACALFFVVAYIQCRREFKMSLPVKNDFVALWLREHPLHRLVQIRQSDRIKAPLTYGVFRPVMLLPKQTDWTDEARLKVVFAHEFVHIRRLDTLTKLVLTAAVCVHWFNPFVWAMYVLANRDIELSCDETVVRTFGETIKSAYALTLIGLEEKKSRLTPLVNNFSKNAIEERIVSIMKIKEYSLPIIIIAILLVVGVTVGFTTSNASTSNHNTSPSSNNTVPDGTPENKGELSDLEDNSSPANGNSEFSVRLPENIPTDDEEIAPELLAGSFSFSADENEPTIERVIERVYVGPSKTDENVQTVYHPVSRKYFLKRTDPDTGKRQVSIDDGATWLFYRDNRDNSENRVSEISADGATWYDFEAAFLASEFGNCRYYLKRNEPNTGKRQASYDDGATWLFWRHNEETHKDEVSADGAAWQPAPLDW